MRMISRGSQQALRDEERTQHIVGNNPTRVADQVRLAFFEPEQPVDIQACIHAGDDRYTP